MFPHYLSGRSGRNNEDEAMRRALNITSPLSDLDEAEARLKEARKRGGSDEWKRMLAEAGKAQGQTEKPLAVLFPGWKQPAFYISSSPAEFDYNYRRAPLLLVLAHADRKALGEIERAKAYETLVRAKHPMAFMMLFMR